MYPVPTSDKRLRLEDDGGAHNFARQSHAALLPDDQWGSAQRRAPPPQRPHTVDELLRAPGDAYTSACYNGELSLTDMDDEFEALPPERADQREAAQSMRAFEAAHLRQRGAPPRLAPLDERQLDTTGMSPEQLAAPVPLHRLLAEVLPATGTRAALLHLTETPRVLLTEPPARTEQRGCVAVLEAHARAYRNWPPRGLDQWMRELERQSSSVEVGEIRGVCMCATLRIDDALFAGCVLARPESLSATHSSTNTANTTEYEFLGLLFFQSVGSHRLDLLLSSPPGPGATSP